MTTDEVVTGPGIVGENGAAEQEEDTLDGGLPWRVLTVGSIAAAAAVSMAEVSRLAARGLDQLGRAWPINDLLGGGPDILSSYRGWYAVDEVNGWGALLQHYLALDALFIGCYFTVLGGVLLRRPGDSWPLTPLGVVALRRSRPPFGVLRPIAVTILIGLVAADILEGILALVVVGLGAHPVGVVALAGATFVKSCLALGVVVAAVVVVLDPAEVNKTPRDGLAVAFRTVSRQRLLLVPLLVVGAVIIIPKSNILDQAPDIVRGWTDSWPMFVSQGFWALLVLQIWVATSLVLGRAHTHLAARNHGDPDASSTLDCRCRDYVRRVGPAQVPPCRSEQLEKPRLWYWWVPVGVLIVSAGVVAALGGHVEVGRLAIVCLVPATVVLLSQLLRSSTTRRRRAIAASTDTNRSRLKVPLTCPVPLRLFDRSQLSLIMRLGDVFALALVVVAAIGAIRAMVPLLFGDALDQQIGLRTWLLLGAGVLGLGIWGPADWCLRWISEQSKNANAGSVIMALSPRPGAEPPTYVPRLGWVVGFGAVALFGLMCLFPYWIAAAGPLTVFSLGVLTLTAVVAGAGVVARMQPPAELFQFLRLRSTPVLSLFLLIVILAGMVTASTPIHPVRESPPDPVGDDQRTDPRQDLAATITTWAAAQRKRGECLRPGGSATVKTMPMVMIAAEGGGIRAAYWAVESVRKIHGNSCGRTATVFASGVSGGAVGLAVARFNGSPQDVVNTMSGPQALALGLTGLFSRDFAYAATGIAPPVLDDSQSRGWIDRAGLMEDAWNKATESSTPTGWKDAAFLGESAHTGQPAPETPGRLILNSMSVGNACRVWVSEIKLQSPTPLEDRSAKLRCEKTGVSGLRAVDLISDLAEYGQPWDVTRRGCIRRLKVSTAAMLAARFPYVTPSGHVGPCASEESDAIDQLVDGGYLENTGLGTINELGDTWIPTVRQWNANQAALSAAAGKSGKSQRVVIVPLIVYLDNDTGNDRATPNRNITNEFLVPPLAVLRADSGTISDEANLQRSVDLVTPASICSSGDQTCETAVNAIAKRVFYVYPKSGSQISAPLGWTLSEATRQSMRTTADAQADSHCKATAGTDTVTCERGYGLLGDLLTALKNSG